VLKITIHDSARECRLHLEGKLSGAWVKELEMCWRTAASTTGGRITAVDLCEVDFADDAGEALLRAMYAAGVRFTAVTPVMRALVEEITGQKLPSPAPDKRHGCHMRRLATLFSLALGALACAAVAYGSEPAAARESLDRYLAASAAPDSGTGTARRVEIHASLPKLHRSGALQALEYLPRGGRAVFQVLGFQGDGTVKRQVIARYLAADAEARQRDTAPVAISHANYAFQFERGADYLGRAAWVYRVKPRASRIGLFHGELWLDAATAAPLRQWGYFVKSPSVFVRRIRFVRDYDLTAGGPRRLILNIETRLAGGADLTVWYEPAASSPAAIAAVRCATFGGNPDAITSPESGRSDVLNRTDGGFNACAL
jgi:hypothetical protein